MSTLLQISDELQTLDALLAETAESGGDISEVEATIAEWFAQLGEQRDQKLDNYCSLISELELRAAARKEEADRLSKRVKADGASADFLKARLKMFFELNGLRKVETSRYSIGVVNNGGKLPLNITESDPKRLPDEYVKRITTTEPDNEKIRAALDAGTKLPFASYEQRGTRLNIR